MSSTAADSELKARHRKMWASGDYPSMVETFLLPLGPRLVDACGIGEGMRVLDVAAGTGNASIVAAQRGANVTASDLTPELFEAGRARAASEGVERELFGDRVEWTTLERDNLEIDAFEHPRDYGVHFKDRYGPTIATYANAAKNGQEGELDEALMAFCEEWNLGTDDDARFEQEYLVSVGTRA